MREEAFAGREKVDSVKKIGFARAVGTQK